MKDFFGKELAIGDIVALLEKAGSSSVYIREGTVTGFTKQKVQIEFVPQGVTYLQTTAREPNNVIKK